MNAVYKLRPLIFLFISFILVSQKLASQWDPKIRLARVWSFWKPYIQLFQPLVGSRTFPNRQKTQ